MGDEEYMQGGVHIGMKQQTANMKKFIYKIRQDGLAIMNVALIEERIKIAAKFLSKFERIMVVSRKLAGQKPATKFAELTGAKANVGRFLPGTITNPAFPGYFEPQVIVVTDPLIDRQAVNEAMKQRIPVIALCDTFNETGAVDLVIPCNNKGRKSLAIVWWALTRELLKARGTIKENEEFTVKPEEFEAPEEPKEIMQKEEKKLTKGRKGVRRRR